MRTLLEAYWENIDPTDSKGQFVDKGTQYLSAIFVEGVDQKEAAEHSLAAVAKKFAPTPIATKILPAQPFYAAEHYHQDYYKTHAINYDMYKYGSGRKARLDELWDGKK
ncbi:MAG: peptide-methionine (S)-S-oxide reductase [Alphaproteobacteria bacterium]